jgi:Rab-like protein 2
LCLLPFWFLFVSHFLSATVLNPFHLVDAPRLAVDYRVTERSFAFPQRRNLPFYFVSASDGTNVVKVFQQAITLGLQHKENPSDDYMTMALELLGEMDDTEKK